MVGSVANQGSELLVGSRLRRALILLLVLLLIASLFALHTGYAELSLTAIRTDARARAVFMELRLPRVVLAGIVGASLSSVGAALQALFRNPLAEPFTLGVSGGATLGASIAIALGFGAGVAGIPAVFGFAFAGAGAAMAAVYLLARTDRGVAAATMLLSGIVINLCATAAVMLVQYLADFNRASQILRWMIGSLDVVGFSLLGRMLLLLVPGWLILVWSAPELNLVAMGNETARTLGVNVRAVERRTYVAASLIVAVTASAGGNIGFVGLIVPHVTRRLFGQDLRILIPASFLLGAGFLIVADAAARSLLSPSELPTGIVTALLGGPFLLWLLGREQRRGSL
ncbi:MAG: FecCD family ABC transporter permease [Blastocatellia bacterium]